MSWLGFERRWRDALLEALLPGTARVPGAGTVNLEPSFGDLLAAAPPLLRLGLRAGVWGLSLSPPFLLGRLALFPSLDPGARDELLVRAAASRSFLVRQLVQTLKLAGCLCLAREPSFRAALGAAVATREEP